MNKFVIAQIGVLIFGTLIFFFSEKLAIRATTDWEKFSKKKHPNFKKVYTISFIVVGVIFIMVSLLGLLGILKYAE
jgi:hypothetical protein